MEPQQASVAQFLRDDHKKIRGLFRQIQVLEDRAHEMKPGLLRQLWMELEIHDRLDREILYPALMSVADEGVRGRIADLLDAHREMRDGIESVKEISEDSEYMRQKMRELRTNVLVHFDDEEHDILGFAERNLHPARSRELFQEMKQRKRELLDLPYYKDAGPEKVQNPRGGEQKRKAG
ncbi:MAG TPA: hemerythrin domain-containing protein [Bdellovibrionota bacterium]|nr:hemerythrin domain-containing protein [Bdellovibrionota bacterium]